jgi:hypothetical protein
LADKLGAAVVAMTRAAARSVSCSIVLVEGIYELWMPQEIALWRARPARQRGPDPRRLRPAATIVRGPGGV